MEKEIRRIEAPNPNTLDKEQKGIKIGIKEIAITIAIQIILEKLIGELSTQDIVLITVTTVIFFIALLSYPLGGWLATVSVVVIVYLMASIFNVFPPFSEIELTESWEAFWVPKGGPIFYLYKTIKGFIITYGWLNLLIAAGLSIYFIEEKERLRISIK